VSRRTRRPDTQRLEISRGDWLLVKKHVTAGDQRGMFRRMMREGMTGDRIDSVRVGWAKCIAYLLDWSFLDADDKPIVIADQSEDAIGAALDALDPEDFAEVLKAIETHENAMEAERAAEKNAAAGSASSAT
jgi:hypothetical protein